MVTREKIDSGTKRLNNLNGFIGALSRSVTLVVAVCIIIASIGVALYKVEALEEKVSDHGACIDVIQNDQADADVQLATTLTEMQVKLVFIEEAVKDIQDQLREEHD
jgi:hypothetical protein